MKNLHKYQMEILRQLLFKPNSRFTELNVPGLTSDHFTYHINGLIELGFINKDEEGRYALTSKGKEVANMMDTDEKVVEKQGKIAVLIVPEREVNGEKEIVIHLRLKEPYYNHYGLIGGKARFGETLEQAAARELMEEGAVEAEKIELVYITHELVYAKSGELLEDKIFHVFKATGIKGEIQEKFEGGENKWVKVSELDQCNPKCYSVPNMLEWYFNPPEKFFIEKSYVTDAF